jgi:hypothetical protein
VSDDLGQPGRLDAIEPIEEPRRPGGAFDERALELVTGRRVRDPGVDSGLVGPRIFAGQQDRLGLHTVLQGIPSRAILTLERLGPTAPGAVAPADLGPLDRRQCHLASLHGAAPAQRRTRLSVRGPADGTVARSRLWYRYASPTTNGSERG